MLGLSRDQKEAVGLLSIGTFLEYFDLMLYVHMAALLNELFFPATDSHTAQLLLYPSPMKVLEKSLEIGYKCSYDKISTAQ